MTLFLNLRKCKHNRNSFTMWTMCYNANHVFKTASLSLILSLGVTDNHPVVSLWECWSKHLYLKSLQPVRSSDCLCFLRRKMSQVMLYPINWTTPSTLSELTAIMVSQWVEAVRTCVLQYCFDHTFWMAFISWSYDLTLIKIISICCTVDSA